MFTNQVQRCQVAAFFVNLCPAYQSFHNITADTVIWVLCEPKRGLSKAETTLISLGQVCYDGRGGQFINLADLAALDPVTRKLVFGLFEAEAEGTVDAWLQQHQGGKPALRVVGQEQALAS